MHLSIKSLVATAALGLALALPSAHAQLLLSGSTYGEFIDPGLVNTTVTNGAVVSLFESGVPYKPAAPFNHTKTSIEFTGSVFTDVGDGEQLDLGTLKITNGRTLLGTTAKTAAMDLYFNIPSEGVWSYKLTTLLFAIDSTANTGTSGVPDLFYIGHTGVSDLHLDNTLVNLNIQFTNPAFSIGDGAAIAEGQFAFDGLYATLSFTPVPEPSTYALAGAALLIGVIGVRRFRTQSAI